MPSFRINPDSIYEDGPARLPAIRKNAFNDFNPSVLGLGDIKQPATAIPAIAALFDLQGFTSFCKQIEPHLSVPIYLSQFLDWIFSAIRTETIRSESADGVVLWHDLPFFTKFMGDGLLVIWNSSSITPVGQINLISSCRNILSSYRTDFLPKMRRKVTDTAVAIRCGIAKGTIFSVGNGEDYVGSCINMPARLQKLAGLKFAFAIRGFNPEDHWDEAVRQYWVLKKVSIPGIGENELIYARKDEFDQMNDEDKELFSGP
jgi:hypothetical protein